MVTTKCPIIHFINSDSASFSCCCQYRVDVYNAKVTFAFSVAFMRGHA